MVTEVTWLGYKINPDGIIPTKRKTEAIIKMDPPKTLKQLRSLMGSIHHRQKFIPNLSQISAPLRPLISHKEIIENKQFDTNRTTRVRCDSSKYQRTKYNMNELELLSVVWSLEHFKYYLYGSCFTLQTDHQALLSALKDKRGNQTYQSRLTRWVDKLIPFIFQ